MEYSLLWSELFDSDIMEHRYRKFSSAAASRDLLENASSCQIADILGAPIISQKMDVVASSAAQHLPNLDC